MRHEQPPTRSATMAAATTTLLALMAMASTASAAVTPRAAHDRSEHRSVLMMDAQAVRCVAGAIAAAARDLLSSSQPDAVMPAMLWTDELELPEAVRTVHIAAVGDPAQPLLLGERLLDLPPPAC